MGRRTVKTAKGLIEYRVEGNGPVVLVLQGGHCSRDTRLSHEKLADLGFTVLTPSRPGYDSTPVSVGSTAQETADALAALLDGLGIDTVSVIGISAAGPTALALAKQHGGRTRSLILESAVTMPWDPALKLASRLLFGPTEKLTWAMVRFSLQMMPNTITKMMMGQFTTLKVNDVMRRMGPGDLGFVKQMLYTMRSGRGFMQDVNHWVPDLHTIHVPVLVMYSPYDKSVPPRNAERIGREIAHAELYEVSADSHLIWIGHTAREVWDKRLEFLNATLYGID
ncbi:MAG: alpha/beta hydrolase [Firmicutes bacterium]|nr:alpha/beta hydrolase [Bacillota bacterium]